MDIKEKRRKYYIDNRDRINERNKQYYYNNIVERQRYNTEYWSLNGHKYVEKRRKDNDYNQNKVYIIRIIIGKEIKKLYLRITF